jgi:hypothetical protein
MRDDDHPMAVKDLPLPTDPGMELVFLRMVMRELAFQGRNLLRGLVAQEQLRKHGPGFYRGDTAALVGPAQLKLDEAVSKAEDYLAHLTTADGGGT